MGSSFDVAGGFRLPPPEDTGTLVNIDANFEIPLKADSNVSKVDMSDLEITLRQCISAAKYGVFELLFVTEDFPRTKKEANKQDILSPEYKMDFETPPLPPVLVYSHFSKPLAGKTEDQLVRAVTQLDRDESNKFVYRWKIIAGAQGTTESLPTKRIVVQTKLGLLIQRRSIAEPEKFFGPFPQLITTAEKELTRRITAKLSESAIAFLKQSKIPVDFSRLPTSAPPTSTPTKTTP